VWIGEGRSGTLLITFFDQLGPERCAQTEAITMDMTRIWRGPVLEYLPYAAIYFDPFHVINGPATPSTWSTRPPPRPTWHLDGLSPANPGRKSEMIYLRHSGIPIPLPSHP
jgi:transposase